MDKIEQYVELLKDKDFDRSDYVNRTQPIDHILLPCYCLSDRRYTKNALSENWKSEIRKFVQFYMDNNEENRILEILKDF